MTTSAGALLFTSLPESSDYSAEGERVLWTLVGVGIAVLVMLLGELLAKRGATARPNAASRSTAAVSASGEP